MSRSLADYHTDLVKRLLKDNKKVYRPKCIECWEKHEPDVYSLSHGELVCGHAIEEKDGTISIEHDMLCYYHTGFKYEELGLIDSHAWYELQKVQAELLYGHIGKKGWNPWCFSPALPDAKHGHKCGAYKSGPQCKDCPHDEAKE